MPLILIHNSIFYYGVYLLRLYTFRGCSINVANKNEMEGKKKEKRNSTKTEKGKAHKAP